MLNITIKLSNWFGMEIVIWVYSQYKTKDALLKATYPYAVNYEAKVVMW